MFTGILGFWMWTDGEAEVLVAAAGGGMLMTHAGYLRRGSYRMRIKEDG